jgi:hypothetical protein
VGGRSGGNTLSGRVFGQVRTAQPLSKSVYVMKYEYSFEIIHLPLTLRYSFS